MWTKFMPTAEIFSRLSCLCKKLGNFQIISEQKNDEKRGLSEPL